MATHRQPRGSWWASGAGGTINTLLSRDQNNIFFKTIIKKAVIIYIVTISVLLPNIFHWHLTTKMKISTVATGHSC